MKNLNSAPTVSRTSSFEGFAELDLAYKNATVTSNDLARFGNYEISNTVILDTPPDVVEKGYVLTNPSQIETIESFANGDTIQQNFAYFRHEPSSLHLGHTKSVPYLIHKDMQGNPYLSRFEDAMELEGEDPRITRDVRIKGVTGKIHKGWLISTTVAEPSPDDPAYAKSIEQVFHWGETLSSLEVVAVLKDTKNTTIYPVASDYKHSDDTSIDVFSRPKPHTSYLRLPDITALTNEALESQGVVITEGLYPEGFYGGPNYVKGAGPGYRELDIHEATLENLPDKRWKLHYRLGRYGFELPRQGLPAGRLKPLGVIATRQQFPEAPAKPPENGVADYWDVLYGSMGNVDRNVGIGQRAGRMLVGVSDSRVGMADVIRIK